MANDFRTNTKALKNKIGLGTKTKIAIGVGGIGALGLLIWKFFIY